MTLLVYILGKALIANVQDYQKLLEDSERVLLTNERRIETENNRSIERLQQDNVRFYKIKFLEN